MRGPAATLALVIVIAQLLTSCRNADHDLSVYLQAKRSYASDDLVSSERALVELLRIDRDFFQARLLLGKARLLQRKFLDAEKTLDTLVRDVPQYRDARLWWLRSLIQLERSAQAPAEIEQLLAWDTDDPRLLLLMPQVAALDGTTEEIIAMYGRASLFSEELASGALQLGRTFYHLGELERARLAVAEAARLSAPDGILRVAVAELAQLLESGE